MGLLKKVLGQDEQEEERSKPEEIETLECPHSSLTPHWEAMEDMGKPEKATYRCEACGQVFDYEQAQKFQERVPPVLVALQEEEDR